MEHTWKLSGSETRVESAPHRHRREFRRHQIPSLAEMRKRRRVFRRSIDSVAFAWIGETLLGRLANVIRESAPILDSALRRAKATSV